MDYISDYELVYMIRQKSDTAYRLLYEKYVPMMWKKAHEKARLYNSLISADEFYSEALVVFTKVVNSYRFDLQVEFATYLYSAVEYSCAQMIRVALRNKSMSANISDDLTYEIMIMNLPDMNKSRDPVSVSHVDTLLNLLKEALDECSEIEKLVMEEFVKGTREVDIMRKCNLTRRKVDYIRGKFQKRFQNMLYLKDYN